MTTKKTIDTTNESVDDFLKLDNQLCFALYVCSKEIIRKYKPLLDPLGLTYTSYIALLALWEKDNITVKELGKRLYLDSGTLTPLLKKMEADNYLTRIRSLEDERNVYIQLTDKGRALKSEAKDIPSTLICSTQFDPNTAYGMLQSLHMLMDHINE